ncbi:hypothetical protein ACLKA7_001384 [Drosophila subpalustris]
MVAVRRDGVRRGSVKQRSKWSDQLRAKLTELQLSTVGRKAELEARLFEHYGIEMEEEDSDDNMSVNTAPMMQSSERGRPWFTLKDVEGSVNKFDGSNSMDIEQWVTELEECAMTVQWSDQHLFVYAKQLLVGAAKSFIRSQRGINDWEMLKAALKGEFEIKLSSAEVHKRLGKRQQKKVPVTLDNIQMKIEFHVVPDEDIGFEAILDRTILDYVDLQVTKGGTLITPKVVVSCAENIIGSKRGSCSEMLNEFESMCMLTLEQDAHFDQLELPHLNPFQQKEVVQLIHSYKPIRNPSSPIEMKIVLTDELPVYQHPRRIAVCDQEIVDEQVKEWLSEKIIRPRLVADAVAQRTGLSWTCESCREVESEMRAFMRQTRSGFKDLSVGFNKLNAQFLAVDAQFNSLKLPAESPKRKKSTPRDLQTTAISQFSTVEQFLTPTTPSAPQTMFATPIASMDVDIPIVDAVPTDTASSAPLSDSSAVVKKRTSRPKPNIAPPPVIVTAGSPVSLEATALSLNVLPQRSIQTDRISDGQRMERC